MTFQDLGLIPELIQATQARGYDAPTPIQSQAIPAILAGKDLLAGAQTGTGKTAAFTLPLLQRLAEAPRGRHPRALILTPTRELAAQVGESVAAYGAHLPLRHAVIFGGVKINPQIQRLRAGVDIVVATPGRLLDHLNQGTVSLDHIGTLILDEADRMLDMGFIRDIEKILARLPEKRQTLFFSATFNDEIKCLSRRLLNAPIHVQVSEENATAVRIQQRVIPVAKAKKRALLSYLVGSQDWRQVLVFTRTKHGANRLAQQLERDGLSAAAIHGNKSQGARTRALADFKRGQVRALVATDIAARGLDIDQLPHVVNFELPNVAEDYVHRIGRTGRAGKEGAAISLVCVDELKLLRDIERLLGRELPKEVVEGYAPDPSIPAEPIRNGRGGGDARKHSQRPRQEGKGGSRARRPTSRPGRASRSRPTQR